MAIYGWCAIWGYSVAERRYWTGDEIGKPDPVIHKNAVLVFGSNPTGFNSKGVALTARMHWGAGYGVGFGRGHHGRSYGLVTKSLKPGFTEPATGIVYRRYGERSVSLDMIRDNVEELYRYCRTRPELLFIVPYRADSANLNGYSSRQMIDVFVSDIDVPDNIVFHSSWRRYLTRWRHLYRRSTVHRISMHCRVLFS